MGYWWLLLLYMPYMIWLYNMIQSTDHMVVPMLLYTTISFFSAHTDTLLHWKAPSLRGIWETLPTIGPGAPHPGWLGHLAKHGARPGVKILLYMSNMYLILKLLSWLYVIVVWLYKLYMINDCDSWFSLSIVSSSLLIVDDLSLSGYCSLADFPTFREVQWCPNGNIGCVSSHFL